MVLASCTAGNHTAPLCAPSLIEVRPVRASPGQAVVIAGQNFARGCNDLGGSHPTTAMEPEKDVRVEFRQGPRIWTLVTVHANSGYWFQEVVEIPVDAHGGPATVVAFGDDGHARAEITVL